MIRDSYQRLMRKQCISKLCAMFMADMQIMQLLRLFVPDGSKAAEAWF